MKIAYLDCFSGISGDMFLAAFLDAQAIEPGTLEKKLSTLGLGKVKLVLKRVKRGAIAATHLSFQMGRLKQSSARRGFAGIRRLIEESPLTTGEQRRAIAIFRSLAKVEAKIHDEAIEDVHFHELGALDSILDIVGAAIIIEQLGAEKTFVSKINMGSGFVKTDHGHLPVPVPSALELLKDMPTYSSGVEAELVTPTGAAILRHLAPMYEHPPARWQAIGYGAGTRELETPNVLRVLVGEGLSQRREDEEALVIETDIDDMSPQIFPYVQQLLFQHGAQDVNWHALHMKKNRPGVRLYVLSPPERVDALCEIVFRETSTLGVRIQTVKKRRLDRKMIHVSTPHGRVRVKLGFWRDRLMNVAPEYDDCVQLANQTGVPVKEIVRLATENAHRKLKT